MTQNASDQLKLEETVQKEKRATQLNLTRESLVVAQDMVISESDIDMSTVKRRRDGRLWMRAAEKMYSIM